MSKRRTKPVNSFGNFELRTISALTENQSRVLRSDEHKVMHGSAGTGKTFLGVYQALEAITANEYNKLVIIRSTVSTRDIGFMPGNEEEKAKMYERPYVPIVNELFNRGDAYPILKQKGTISFEITSFLRGTTFNDCFILVDEIQNMNYHELDTVMTRIGKNCKIILCGDYKQTDLKDSGVRKFLEIVKSMQSFQFTEFTRDDIVRSGFVKEYIIAKEEYEEGGSK
jgi:phosphate starvation-inducible PhoH-like protein